MAVPTSVSAKPAARMSDLKRFVFIYFFYFGVGGVSNTGADAVGVGAAAVVLSVALDVPPPHAVINAAKQQYAISLISVPFKQPQIHSVIKVAR